MTIELGKCMACYGVRLELEQRINDLSSFRKSIVRPLDYINDAIDRFYDDDTFEQKIEFIQEQSKYYISMMGEAAAREDTEFLRNLKEQYRNTPVMQRNPFINKALSLKIPTDIEKLKTVDAGYASAFLLPIMMGVSEKLAFDFNTPEFIVGLNSSIIDFNLKNGKIEEVYQQVLDALQFIEINECYHDRYIQKWKERINNSLNLMYMKNGVEMDWDRVYEGLSEERIQKVKKSKKCCSIILLNSWNEIRIKTGSDKMFIINAYTALG